MGRTKLIFNLIKMISIRVPYSNLIKSGYHSRIKVLANAANQVVTDQYAQALFATAMEKGDLETINSDMITLANLWEGNDGLCGVMANLYVPADKKTNLVEAISNECSFNHYTENCLKLLVDNGRIEGISGVIKV